MTSLFDKDYFLNGIETGKSNYENYSWKPSLTINLANSVSKYLKIKNSETFLDYGCARGYLVNAMRILGIDAYGVDISEWAIENCHPDVTPFVAGRSYL